MADRFVSVVAPDGEPGEIPEGSLAQALQAGFKVADAAPSAPAAPQGPRMVPIVAPDGEEGEVPESELPRALQAGFRTHDDIAAERANTGFGSRVAAAGEAVAQGLSLGMQTPIAAVEAAGATLGNLAYEGTHEGASDIPYSAALDQAQESVGARGQYNPVTHGVGEVTGVLLPALATGGGALAATPTALAARGAGAVAKQAVTRIAPSALRGLAKPAIGLLTQGAAEGAAYGAAREVDQAFARGDYDGLAEKVAAGAVRGAGLGGAASLGGSALLEGGKALVRGAGNVVPAMRKLAGESAYKAVVGRTNQAAIKAAGRHGGAEAVGQTLMEEGVDLTQSADQIYSAVNAKAEQVGAELGLVRGEIDHLSGGQGLSRVEVWRKGVAPVLKELRKSPVNADIADSLESSLSYLKDDLTGHMQHVPIGPSRVPALKAELEAQQKMAANWERLPPARVDAIRARVKELTAQIEQEGVNKTARTEAERSALDRISFEDTLQIRKDLDKRIAWEKFNPSVSLQARRDIRNGLEDFWIESADDVAEKAGKLGLAEQLQTLKQRYARLALARDQAEQAVIVQLSNRSTSLTDTMAGVGAGVGAGDPITGFLASQAHKLVRERGRGYLAHGLDRAANFIEGRTADRALGAAAQAQQAVNKASLLKGLLSGVGITGEKAARGARAAFTFEQVNQKLADLEPGSPAKEQLAAVAGEVHEDSPELAQAMLAADQKRTAFLASKAGPSPALFGGRRLMDASTRAKFVRYMEASDDPIAALERLSHGHVRTEDVEALQALAPKMFDEFRRKAAANLANHGQDIPYPTRTRLAAVLGVPPDASQSPEHTAWLQALAQNGAGEEPTPAPGRVSGFKTHSDAYQTQTLRAAP